MTHRLTRRQLARGALAAALAIGLATPAVSAPAKPLAPAQQAQIRPGMTMDEVTAAIGKPEKVRKYGKGEATWGYRTRQNDIWFLVDFGRDGKVKLAKEQIVTPF
jgi:outer membrane protein assembly factor BamE (lipoprotein component of BamABCDE complex)